MGYAVPALLARGGLLAELWTDVHAEDWLAKWFARLVPDRFQPRVVRALLGRRIPVEIDRAAVLSFPALALSSYLRRAFPDPPINGRLMHRGFAGATALYSLSFGDVDVIRAAKLAGLYVVFEQVITPVLNPILREERCRHPGIEPQEDPADEEHYAISHRTIWDLADVILSPSEFVSEGIHEMGGNLAKVRLVPYAVNDSWFGLAPSPQVGRILSTGTVGLRKGTHYLAEATRILRKRNVPCDVRVAGSCPEVFRERPLFSGPKYLGAIARPLMHQEYISADVFVLPTLAEGSALAHIEALACGIPVITTPHCGTFIRDGVEGFVVPIRDAKAIADRIELLVKDRGLRDRMSAAARLLALQHTWSSYQSRLLETLGAGDRTGAAVV